MAGMSAQALRTAVISAVTTESSFRDELAKDATKAIQSRFGDQSLKPHVEFEKEGELSFVIPQQTEKLSQAIARAVAERGDRQPTRGEFESALILRAWNDPAFLAELRSNPNAALDTALKAHNGGVPAGATVRLYEEQPGECLVVIPRPADAASELSDAELEAVAGGEVGLLIAGAIVGAIAGEVVHDILHPSDA
jgi:hypothetical protein